MHYGVSFVRLERLESSSLIRPKMLVWSNHPALPIHGSYTSYSFGIPSILRFPPIEVQRRGTMAQEFPGLDLCLFPAGAPPTGQTSNLVNPHTLVPVLISVCVIMSIGAILFTLCRLAANRKKLWWSDCKLFPYVHWGEILSCHRFRRPCVPPVSRLDWTHAWSDQIRKTSMGCKSLLVWWNIYQGKCLSYTQQISSQPAACQLTTITDPLRTTNNPLLRVILL